MTSITCLVLDDQIDAVDLLVDHIKKIPLVEIKLATTDPMKALAFLDANEIDCIFSDIDMPLVNGLDFIETLRLKVGNKMPKIVFCTGYSQYALQGYEHGVFDYLLKPITFKRFKVCVDRLLSSQVTKLDDRDCDFFFIETDGQKLKIRFDEVAVVEAAGNYIFIVTDSRKNISYSTMAKMEDVLPKTRFIRVHKSFIVSLAHIQSIRNNEIHLNIGNMARVLPVGLTYKSKLFKTLRIKE